MLVSATCWLMGVTMCYIPCMYLKRSTEKAQTSTKALQVLPHVYLTSFHEKGLWCLYFKTLLNSHNPKSHKSTFKIDYAVVGKAIAGDVTFQIQCYTISQWLFSRSTYKLISLQHRQTAVHRLVFIVVLAIAAVHCLCSQRGCRNKSTWSRAGTSLSLITDQPQN